MAMSCDEVASKAIGSSAECGEYATTSDYYECNEGVRERGGYRGFTWTLEQTAGTGRWEDKRRRIRQELPTINNERS